MGRKTTQQYNKRNSLAEESGPRADEKISIGAPLSGDFHTNAFNLPQIFFRILPLFAFWTPTLILSLAEKQDQEALTSWGKLLSIFLLILALSLCIPRITEFQDVLRVKKATLNSVLAAVLAVAATQFLAHVSEDKCITYETIQFPNAHPHPLLRGIFAVLSATSSIILVPLAEELALRSWLYRETVFMVKYGKEEFASVKDFTEVPFSSWQWFPALQCCAACGILHQASWSKAFVARSVLHGVSSWGGSFLHAVHAHWLFCAVDVCFMIACR